MTREKAIENLKGLLECSYVDSFEDTENEALKMAIETMEDIDIQVDIQTKKGGRKRSEVVYNDLIKLCNVFIDTALSNLMNVGIYDIWKEEYDPEIKACVLVQLRAIASIKDRIEKLHNINLLGGFDDETSDS